MLTVHSRFFMTIECFCRSERCMLTNSDTVHPVSYCVRISNESLGARVRACISTNCLRVKYSVTLRETPQFLFCRTNRSSI